MRPTHLISCLIIASCSSPAESPPDAAPPEPDASVCAPSDHILFLNRAGGTYYPSETNDSSTNSTSMLEAEATLAPYPYTDASWSAIVDCVRDKYAPFDIAVTDVDPGDTPHFEVALVDNTSTDLGYPAGAQNLAVFDCAPIWSGIGFVLLSGLEDDPAYDCWLTAKTSSFLLGLDNTIYCEDITSQRFDCPVEDKEFVDYYGQCGETGPRSCHCGGQFQNSYKKLVAILGEACP